MTDTTMLCEVAAGTVTVVPVPNTRDGGFHPHTVTVYTPANTTVQLQVLADHGGGGSAPTFAQSLLIKQGPAAPSVSNVWWAVLQGTTSEWWFPTAGIPDGTVTAFNPNGADMRALINAYGTAGVELWSNRGTWSGWDDYQFHKDVSALMQSRRPSAIRMVMGHSDGGIMVQDRWFQEASAPYYFHVYYTAAGPGATYYETQPMPTIPRPMRSVVGRRDTNIGVLGPDGTDHLFDAEWAQRTPPTPAYAAANYVWPSPQFFIGEWVQLQARVNAYNTHNSRAAETIHWADGTPHSTSLGTTTEFSYCGGAMQLAVLGGVDHDLITIQRGLAQTMVVDACQFAFAHYTG
jgi:hypothetical protein